jgi:CRISPR-associated protein Cmr2
VSSALVAIAIGPVQPFIAAARKTRDLWCGSTLLSRACCAVACVLADEDVTRLVFPAPETLEDLEPDDARPDEFPVANRVVAVVDGEPGALAQEACAVASDELRRLAKNAFDGIRSPFDRELAERQVGELLETAWAAVPLENPDDDRAYRAARSRLDALLAARKATRDFAQPDHQGDTGQRRKCSIDGLRETVLLHDEASKEAAQRKPFEIAKGEWLCGVSLLKRHAFKGRAAKQPVPSTSGLASAPTRRLLEQKHPDSWKTFRDEMNRLEADDEESWLFEDRLVECVDGDPDRAQEARAALRKLFDDTKVPRPRPYYALLRADGDGMGRLIDAQPSRAAHRELSAALVRFATEAREVIGRHGGHAVYAGGDDVLALLPLESALVCAREVVKAFDERLQRVSHADGTQPSLSAGLVIAHHLEPLSHTLARSEGAEKAAKKEGGGRLAVCVAKRSGGEDVVVEAWDELQELGMLGAQVRAGRIPSGMAYEMRGAARRIRGAENEKALGLAETKRILSRKEPDRGREKALDQDTRNRLLARVERRGLDVVATELIVASELAGTPGPEGGAP